MPLSKAVVLLGMHRSGTSAFSRGLQAIGVYLGNSFLDTKPDNPTGYWEDRNIVDLNDRVLAVFGLKWEDVALIDDGQWQDPTIEALRREAAAYLEAQFTAHSLWGFKDPRTVRLLPFWRSVFQQLAVEDTYVIAIRNPLGVAASLLKRQHMTPITSHKLWLVYLVPYLNQIADRPFVVADYDLMMDDPKQQMERIARHLQIPLDAENTEQIVYFAESFLQGGLRHHRFLKEDFDTIPHVSLLTREAYHWLHRLATDRIASDSPRFWSAWGKSQMAVRAIMTDASLTP
jgi:hypothetical protein